MVEPRQVEEPECWLTLILVVAVVGTVVIPPPILVATGDGRLVVVVVSNPVVVLAAAAAETVGAAGVSGSTQKQFLRKLPALSWQTPSRSLEGVLKQNIVIKHIYESE